MKLELVNVYYSNLQTITPPKVPGGDLFVPLFIDPHRFYVPRATVCSLNIEQYI